MRVSKSLDSVAQAPSVVFSALVMTAHDAFSVVGVSVSPSGWMSAASTLLLSTAFANRLAWIGLTLRFPAPATLFEPMCLHGVKRHLEMDAGGYHVGKRQETALPAICAGDTEGRTGQASVMSVPSSSSPTAPSAPPC